MKSPDFVLCGGARLRSGIAFPPKPGSLRSREGADNGIPGHEAAERAAKAYQAQGHRVVLRFPPERFGDFNDLLREEVAA